MIEHPPKYAPSTPPPPFHLRDIRGESRDPQTGIGVFVPSSAEQVPDVPSWSAYCPLPTML